MNWIQLNAEQQLQEIAEKSANRTQVIFKHSTTCSISSVALNRLNKWENTEEADFYYLDLLKHRNVSNKVAEQFKVHHESPQVLVIKNGECVYDESHMAIHADEVKEQLA